MAAVEDLAHVEEPRLDIVIFGATGYTGKCAVEQIVQLAKEKGNLTWGVAGRNEAKLREVLSAVSKKTGEDLVTKQAIVADVSDEESLLKMAKQARVIVNCAGPYRHYGEPVVKACVVSGTHHVDVSGETQYMERMQLEYHKAAEEKGVYIVSACGLDSIPADLGTVFLAKNFEGDVNSAECYIKFANEGNIKGPGLNSGTWESAVYGVAHENEIKPLRRKLFPNKLPKLTPKLKPRRVVHKNEYVQGWCVPFPGADKLVMERTQFHFFENDKLRPIQVQTYIAFMSFCTIMVVAIFGGIFLLLSKFQCGRKLLLKYPRFFSAGYLGDDPSEETRKNTKYTATIVAKGWKEKHLESTGNHTTPPNKVMVAKVSGIDPAYSMTCTSLLLSAVTILKEADKMPSSGGVYPPGAAFANTSFIEELDKHGITFEIIATKDL